MFDRFTDENRKVMALARKEAQRLNHDFIGTEHILLALMQEGGGVAAHILENLGVEATKLRSEIEMNAPSRPPSSNLGQLPLTPRAKKALELSMEEANELGDNSIGTEHLLLGLLREHDGLAAQVLFRIGINLEDVRHKVLEFIGGENSGKKRAASYCCEFGYDKGEPIRPTAVEAAAVELLNGRSVVIVGDRGSGRSTLARHAARRVRLIGPDPPLRVFRVLVPNHLELRKGLKNGTHAQGILDFAAELEERRAMPVLADLDSLLDPALSAAEVVESWKSFLTAWLQQKIPFLAWTTPEGWELVERALPGNDRVVKRFQSAPLEEDAIAHLVKAKLAEMERGGRIQFAPDFGDAILANRHRWQPGFKLVDPGRSLRLIDAVVMRAVIQTWDAMLKRTDPAGSGEHHALFDDILRDLVLEEIGNAASLFTDLDNPKPSYSLAGQFLPPLTITTGMLSEFLAPH